MSTTKKTLTDSILKHDLISELFKSVETIGVDATSNALKFSQRHVVSLGDTRVDFVLNMVSEYYMQSVDQIIYSRSKSRKRMLALKFAIYYLNEFFYFSYVQLEPLFKRDKSLLCRSCKEIKEMIVKENSIKNTKKEFDKIINNFKLNKNFKNE